MAGDAKTNIEKGGVKEMSGIDGKQEDLRRRIGYSRRWKDDTLIATERVEWPEPETSS